MTLIPWIQDGDPVYAEANTIFPRIDGTTYDIYNLPLKQVISDSLLDTTASFPGFAVMYRGNNSPEGVQTAVPGMLYFDAVGLGVWLKTVGTGNTGWVQVGGGQVNSRLIDAWWRPESSIGTTPPQTGWNAEVGSVVPQWAYAVGGNVISQLISGEGQIVAEVTPGANVEMTMTTIGAVAQPKVYKVNQSTYDYALDPIYRAIVRFRRKVVGGTPGGNFGVELRCLPSTLGQTVGGGNAGGFSLCMDGAGGWKLFTRSQIAGGATSSTVITWPNGDQKYTTWEMRITPATASADAQFELYADGVSKFSQAWGVTPFADYSGSGAPYRFGLCINPGPAGPTDTLLIASARIIAERTLSVA